MNPIFRLGRLLAVSRRIGAIVLLLPVIVWALSSAPNSVAAQTSLDATSAAPVQPAPKPPSADMTCKIPEPSADELSKDPRVKTLNDKLTVDPENLQSLRDRAALYSNKHAYTLALADYSAAIRLGSADNEILNDRCYVRALLDDLAGAAQDCDESLRLNPVYAEALDSRGFVRLKSGQFEAAIVDFNTALTINPKAAASLYARGIAKIHFGDSPGGEADLHAGMTLDGLIGNELASRGIPDPHPEWGLQGVVHINENGVVTVANAVEVGDAIADFRQSYHPGDAGYDEVVRHLCGLKPGDQKFFRPWHHY